MRQRTCRWVVSAKNAPSNLPSHWTRGAASPTMCLTEIAHVISHSVAIKMIAIDLTTTSFPCVMT